MGLPGAEFASYQMYSTMSYDKGELILRMLRDMLGEPTFRQGLRQYYQRFRFHQVTGLDFQRVMEEVSGTDLDWFFRQWLYTTDWLDYRVAAVEVSPSEDGYAVTAELVRDGPAWMPVVVQAGDARVTVESRERRITVRLVTETPPEAVVADPDGSLLDANRFNNRWTVQ